MTGKRVAREPGRNVLRIKGDESPLVRNAAEIAAGLIRRAILEGRLHPGEALREERLAGDLGISRTPIREALLLLQAEGLVEAAPKRGSSVRSYEPAEIADLYETRAVLEGYAARRAARLAIDDDIRRLHESCGRFEQLVGADDVVPLVDENFVFHRVILDVAKSLTLTHLIGLTTHVPLVFRSYYWYSPKDKLIALHYHERITDALARGDASRAEALMNEHILEALDVLSAHRRSAESADAHV
jgi:DNA-binding GntR family transcriptional regulator